MIPSVGLAYWFSVAYSIAASSRPNFDSSLTADSPPVLVRRTYTTYTMYD